MNRTSLKETNLYLDSIIAPSALNEDFFNEVNILAPFGAGNSEPRFAIEDLKVISSDIIANTHIKTLLLGKDGSSFKGFAWNAKGTNLENYLYKNKNKYPYIQVSDLTVKQINF